MPALNSGLQRARATLAAATGAGERPLSEAARRTLALFVPAWHGRDIDALAHLLAEDVILSMAPQLLRFAGRDEVVGFLATVPAGGRLDLIRLVPTHANGQSALATYLPDTDECRGYGIMVFTVAADQITSIIGFPGPATVRGVRARHLRRLSPARVSRTGVAAPTTGRAPARGAGARETTMKYMIMMFGGLGASLQDRSPEWVKGLHELMVTMDTELKEAGELVASHKLMDPGRATTVRFQNGAPAPTDGPFAEIKESLAGYWIVEATEQRAVEITSRVVAYTRYPMEVRRIMEG